MTPEKDLSAISRLIGIYDKLNNSQLNAQELSVIFNVSTRTIYRDIKKMQHAGVEVYSFEEGYKIIN
jgi:predicted DNA-binding transcriptional regulator YafY